MATRSAVEDLRTGFADPSPAARPMMRWWWFGPDVDRAELDRELTAMAAAGLGGVEVAFVYPLSQVSSSFLSAPFLADVSFAAGRAEELGLRFDLTLGSGWPFGGPHITPELAARKLTWVRVPLTGTADTVVAAAPPQGHPELVAAFVAEDPADGVVPQTQPVEAQGGRVAVPPGSDRRALLIAWSTTTGQQVKRAASGAEGPVLDHYSEAAARRHIERVAAPLLAAAGVHRVGSVFCDSMEVYGADWTPTLPVEFEGRRGYPLLPRLAELVVDTAGSPTLRADVRRTQSELYQDNFVAVFGDWAAGQGVPFRIQSYGEPPATLSSYRCADLCEGEGWGWNAIPETRWASSAAHLYHQEQPVVSSEIWTWVHSPSLRATPLDLVGEAHEHLLLGINQFIGHGWPYSPPAPDDTDAGWLFYAAGALDDRNPWWPSVMPDLAGYLQRLCWLMRQGRRVADVHLYVPARDVYKRMGPHTGGTSINLWRETARHIGPAVPRAIREAGFDFTLFDDDAVALTDPATIPLVLLPYAEDVPEETRRFLAAVRESGGVVLEQTDRHEDAGALTNRLRAACAPDVAITPAAPSVGVVHRRLDTGADVYFVANTGSDPVRAALTLRDSRDLVEQWDPRQGVGGHQDPGVSLSLSLDPCQATVFVAYDGEPSAAHTDSRDEPEETTRSALDGPWTVDFGDGPSEPIAVPHTWESDPRRRECSGTATYTTTFAIPSGAERGGRILLDFGHAAPLPDVGAGPAVGGGRSYRAPVTPPVREAARVRVNGHDCGAVWGPPYEVDITERVIPDGPNELQLVVSNTGGGALAVGRRTIEDLVAGVEATYGRRFEMQGLDDALEGVASGILTVPAVVQTRRHGPHR